MTLWCTSLPSTYIHFLPFKYKNTKFKKYFLNKTSNTEVYKEKSKWPLIHPWLLLSCKMTLCKFKVGTSFSREKANIYMSTFWHNINIIHVSAMPKCGLDKEHPYQQLCVSEAMYRVPCWVCIYGHVCQAGLTVTTPALTQNIQNH